VARQKQDALEAVVNRLREVRKEAGDRLSDLLAEGPVKERVAAVADKAEDLRLELARRLRRGEPATKPLDKMTLRELHELAARRHIAGRSSMKKAELIDALRR
jgi:hypothetical protein